MSGNPSFFNGNAKIDGGEIENVDITKSSLDMNFQKITSVASPTDNYDAVNKMYVDSQTTSLTVTLNSTTPALILNQSIGNYLFIIQSTTPSNYPMLSVILAKNHTNGSLGKVIFYTIPGATTGEYLQITWDDGEFIYLSKSGGGYDGQYIVRRL